MEADDLPCSRNTRWRTPLVGRAQWKITQPPSLKIERARLEESFSIDDGRSMHAVQDHLTYAFTPLSIGLCTHRAHATERFSNNRFSRGYFC